MALLCIGILETIVVFLHVLGVQETPNWRWPWRNGHAWPLYPAMAICALPLLAALWLRRRDFHRIALLGVALSTIGFQVTGQIAITSPPSWTRPADIIEDRVCSSYWSDARALVRSDYPIATILKNYPTLMQSFYQHSQEKPPGPVLFYVLLLHLLGAAGHAAAVAGAAAIALGAAAGVPAVYLLARAMLPSRSGAFFAAALYALTPSVIAIYPMFDACYPAVVCVMSLLCIAAIRRGGWVYGFALGLAVAATSLFVYNLLVIGTFLLGVMLIECRCADSPRWRALARAALLSAATVLAVYAALWLASGFDPVATFRAAIRIQQHVNIVARRPYPRTIAYDFFDFLFGTGRMLALLAVLGVAGSVSSPGGCRRKWFLPLCLLQIVIVGSTGLLRGETARVWCFLVPLVTIPAGAALADWPPRWRYAALAVQGLLMLAMVQNVEFNSLALPAGP